jgi:hypothetical protein
MFDPSDNYNQVLATMSAEELEQAAAELVAVREAIDKLAEGDESTETPPKSVLKEALRSLWGS